ncbi:Glycosyl transferase, family 2 domain protein, partial [mine drainage metagenome]
MAARDEQIASHNRTLAERDAQVHHLNQSLAARDEQIASHNRTLADILHSNSWRITSPLRDARRWVEAFMAPPKRYVKATLRASTSVEPVENIVLSTSDSPVVSVIVPVYGKIDYTLRCLKSIENHPPRVTFEVIVVDDCSPDNSTGLLSKVSGVRLIKNTENLGFIRSCNAGAKAASGKYLTILNNNTEVAPDWMDKLQCTFDDFLGEKKIKIAAVTMVYNEALLLPYFLRHYRYLDEIHALYETDSTDESTKKSHASTECRDREV